MIRALIFIILIFFPVIAFSQKQRNLPLLITDSSWSNEIFAFPLSFAPEINFQGWEEAVFPPNWVKKDSTEFWSYAFAWNINSGTKLTRKELEKHLKHYFNGLMQSMNRNKEIKVPNTIARFFPKEQSGDASAYIGKIVVFDAFFTQKALTLNVLVEQYPCKELQKSIVLFRFSPREFGNEVWQELEKVKLREDICVM